MINFLSLLFTFPLYRIYTLEDFQTNVLGQMLVGWVFELKYWQEHKEDIPECVFSRMQSYRQRRHKTT